MVLVLIKLCKKFKFALVKKGFTILEMIIVIIIITILFATGVFVFLRMQEQTIRKEVIANLKLLRAGQIAYRLDTGRYYRSGCVYNLDSNKNLTDTFALNLCSVGSCSAFYLCDSSGCCGAMLTNISTNRRYRIDVNNEEPILGFCIPPSTCPN